MGDLDILGGWGVLFGPSGVGTGLAGEDLLSSGSSLSTSANV